MAESPTERIDREKDRVRFLEEKGQISSDLRKTLFEFADAMDARKTRHKFRDKDGEIATMKPRTIASYLQTISRCISRGFNPEGSTAEEFNAFIDGLHDDLGLAKTTLMVYQASMQNLALHAPGLGINAEEIHFYTAKSKPKHDELDLFTAEEVEQLRRACGDTRSPVRNRAMLELLLYTGQRIMALVTLRIKDVDCDEGYIYLNDEYAEKHGGLKGALRRGRKRPMFGARKYVRDLLDYHPDADDPDAWLFRGDPNHWKTDPEDFWAESSVTRMLNQLKKESGISKPVNPHNCRHYMATVLYADYDIDKDTIRMLLGHVKGSNTLERVYSHVFDDDYIQKAEEKMGLKDPSERKRLTPKVCRTCGALLESDWRRCPHCSETYAPEAASVEAVSEKAKERAGMIALLENLSPEQREGMVAMLEALDDPDAFAIEMESVAD